MYVYCSAVLLFQKMLMHALYCHHDEFPVNSKDGKSVPSIYEQIPSPQET
jgi:hypothetical protein